VQRTRQLSRLAVELRQVVSVQVALRGSVQHTAVRAKSKRHKEGEKMNTLVRREPPRLPCHPPRLKSNGISFYRWPLLLCAPHHFVNHLGRVSSVFSLRSMLLSGGAQDRRERERERIGRGVVRDSAERGRREWPTVGGRSQEGGGARAQEGTR